GAGSWLGSEPPRLPPVRAPGAPLLWKAPPLLPSSFLCQSSTAFSSPPIPLFVSTATLGAVFGATTCLTAELRDAPDDPLNYFIGGCVSGAVLGARAHSFATGSTACAGFGILAALFKISKKEGWNLLGPPKL
uniref:NADH dehydrogenase [ubiquinone] 1 alpha subcomplex subunit 11 n=1 Tax=Varanus komodoensis TaxID=61221 RepID=A0A8D2LCP9_VARKO